MGNKNNILDKLTNEKGIYGVHNFNEVEGYYTELEEVMFKILKVLGESKHPLIEPIIQKEEDMIHRKMRKLTELYENAKESRYYKDKTLKIDWEYEREVYLNSNTSTIYTLVSNIRVTYNKLNKSYDLTKL